MSDIATPMGGSFAEEISKASGTDIRPCYQCRKCSAGCPVAWAMDLLPHQVIRLIQYGCRTEVLACRSIWLCASCHTCSVRCPNEVDFAAVVDSLRHLARKERVSSAECKIPLFHEAFLEEIRRRGRVHELAMLWRFKTKTGDLFKDAALGLQMFAKGKIKLLPPGKTGRGVMKDIFAGSNRRGR